MSELRDLFLELHAVAPGSEAWLGYVFNIVLVVGGARTATLFQLIDFPTKKEAKKLLRAAKKLLKSYKDIRFLKNYQGIYIYKSDESLPKDHPIRIDDDDDDAVADFLDFLCKGFVGGGSHNAVSYWLTYKDEETSFIGYGCNDGDVKKQQENFQNLKTAYQEFADTLKLGIKIKFMFQKIWREAELIEVMQSNKLITYEILEAIDNVFWNWGADEDPLGMKILEQIENKLGDGKKNYRKAIAKYIPIWVAALQPDVEDTVAKFHEDYSRSRAKKKVLEWEKRLYEAHGL